MLRNPNRQRHAVLTEKKRLSNELPKQSLGFVVTRDACVVGAGIDANDADADRLRSLRTKSLSWLQAEVTAWKHNIAQGPPEAGAQAAAVMRDWLSDSSFDAMRGPVELSRFDPAESHGWQELWQDVRTLSASTGVDMLKKSIRVSSDAPAEP